MTHTKNNKDKPIEPLWGIQSVLEKIPNSSQYIDQALSTVWKNNFFIALKLYRSSKKPNNVAKNPLIPSTKKKLKII